MSHRKKLGREHKTLILFILLSLLLHVGILLIPTPNGQIPKEPLFIVERITPDDIEKKQVVDDTKEANKKEPTDSKFLSKDNNRVEKEMRAKETGKTQNSTDAIATQVPQKKNKLSLADLGLGPTGYRPKSSSTPSHIRGPSQTDDYLPRAEIGNQTSLNTREFKYYSYFERIKDRLRTYWEPQLQRRVGHLYNTGQTLPDYDLITKLDITLNRNGELSKITITRNSGYEEIDLAAVKAFELAAPFPNPPSGMVEANGSVRLTWSFVVQTRGISDIFVFLSKR